MAKWGCIFTVSAAKMWINEFIYLFANIINGFEVKVENMNTDSNYFSKSYLLTHSSLDVAPNVSVDVSCGHCMHTVCWALSW
jgi:hypothetical protein